MGNRCTERPPDLVLYGGRLYGGFVNRAVSDTISMFIDVFYNFQVFN